MTVNTIPAEFNGTPLSIIDHDGKRWITAKQAGLALGYNEASANTGINNLYNRHRDRFDEGDTCSIKLMEQGQMRETRIFSATGCVTLGWLSNTSRAVEFQRWAKKTLARQMLAPTLPADPFVVIPGVRVTRRVEREVLEMFVAGIDYREIAHRLSISRAVVGTIVHGKYQFSRGAGRPECPPELIEAVAAKHLAIERIRLAAHVDRVASRYLSTANNQPLAEALDRVGRQLQQVPALALLPQGEI